MNEMPDALREALLSSDGPVGIPVETSEGVAVVVKAGAEEVCSFRGAAVRYQYILACYTEGPVLCLVLEILDDPVCPFGIETFLNVDEVEDLALAEQLAGQREFALHFYDESLTYRFTKRVRQRPRLRSALQGFIRLALWHLQAVEPDWSAARARFMQEVAW